MRVLCVATKAPWPPRDGGRLLLLQTLQALASLDQQVHLVAPADPTLDDPATIERQLADCCTPHLVQASPPGTAATLVRAAWTGMPVSIARHTRAAARECVARLLQERPFDVVHAEQLQALSACVPAAHRAIPVVLRAQNVESDLWGAPGRGSRVLAPLFRWETARLAAWERQALDQVALTVALTTDDAERLRAVSGGRGVLQVVPAPFPAESPASPVELPGKPCVVLLGSQGWRPNEDGAAWFLETAWPEVLHELPAAELHVFGLGRGRGPGIHSHPAPADSSRAFPACGVLAVPLRVASGVRIKILEAWSRGVPVVATPQAAAGLAAEDGRELLLARDGPGFAQALARIHEDAGLRRRLIDAGRAALRARHDPTRVAQALVEAYARAANANGADRKTPTEHPA